MKYYSLLLFTAFFISNYCNAQQKKLFIANDDHTDFMWTANETEYDSAMVQMLDYYIEQADATRSLAPDFQSRFNCDGAYWMRAYERFRSAAQFQRLVAAIQSGHISVPLNYLVNTYGAQPAEAVIRGMYPAGRLQRQYDLDFSLATAMENQTLPLGLSSLWAGSGARYSWRGVCACATKIPHSNFYYRRHQLYHYTGLDGRSVIMKWYNYGGRNMLPGGYAEMRGVRKPKEPLREMAKVVEALDRMVSDTGKDPDYPYSIAGAFGYGWDDLATYTAPLFIETAQKMTNPDRSVRVSNEVDFFQAIEEKYPHLPAESVSYGNEWDLYSVTMQEPTARVRRATEQLRAAEALYTLVALQDSSFGKTFEQQRQDAWEAYGKYWEHDWTADGPVSRNDRAEWQLDLSRQIAQYSDTLLKLSSQELAKYIPAGNHKRFYVFNPLSWERTDVADVPYDGPFLVKVLDVSSGKEVKSQLVQKEGKNYLRILAEAIPSVGFKVFDIVNEKAASHPAAATFSNNYFENEFYRIGIHASGTITSVFDKEQQKELVKPNNGRYFNDLGSGLSDPAGTVILENAGPVSATILVRKKSPIAHSVRITLFTGINRVGINNQILANFGDVRTWAFSLNLDRPETHHEELGAILKVKKKNSGGHYANRNARYDWQTFNHFANLSDSQLGVTISNLDCSFFNLGNSTPDSLHSDASQLFALAGGQIDKDLGIYNQHHQQEFNYHFAVMSHRAPFDALTSMRFSLEHQNPLITEWVKGDKPAYPQKFSFVQVSDPHVLLWSIKPAEEGIAKGVILRAWNFGVKDAKPDFQFQYKLADASQTTHLERDLKQVEVNGKKFSAPFAPNQINTYRVNVLK